MLQQHLASPSCCGHLGVPDSQSAQPTAPTAWRQEAVQQGQAAEDLQVPPWARDTFGTPAKDQGFTPYLRHVREGNRLGQLLFTAGPLLPNEARTHAQHSMAVTKTNFELMSRHVELQIKLESAVRLAQHPVFYQPYSIDFR